VQRAEQRSQQLATALAALVQAQLGSLDVALLQLRREWYYDNGPAHFDAAVRMLEAALPPGAIRQVTVVDEAGNGVYNSLDPDEPFNVSDRPHYLMQREGVDRLHVGQARLTGDTWSFIVNRPLLRNGQFAGTVNLSVPTAYLARPLQQLALGEGDIVAVIHEDGAFIARNRDHDQAMGQSVPGDRPFLLERDADAGLFRIEGAVDGIVRLYAWQRLPGPGLVLGVGLAEDEALTPLAVGRERERWWFSALMLVVLATGTLVVALLWQGSRRQLALEQSERRYRVLIDSSPDAIFVVRGGCFSYVNPATLRLLGAQAAEQLLGRPVLERVHPDLHEEVLARRAVMARGRPVPALEERYIRFDGTEVEAEVMAAPFVDEQGAASQVIARDITDRLRSERALQQLADDLEQRVLERTAELERARAEAERANHAKSEFLSRMSHELRTPLNAILGFGQLLEMQPADEPQRVRVREILNAGRHLLTLIDEVLDLARVEAGHLSVSLEPVALRPLIDECLTLVRPAAAARQVQLLDASPDCADHVRADRTRLKQVLLNLLSNAIKFNHPGGRVEVKCDHEVELTPPQLRIRVVDNGPGLDAAQQQRLFVPFERLDAEVRQIQGTGIGLALSKRLVELMGGRIGVDAERGRGSSFWVQLPRGEASLPPPMPAPAAAAEAPQLRSHRHTVLCIEDNPANLRLIEQIFAHRGDMALISAMTPAAGLDLARSHQPALVLLDINLPDMDGYEVLRCLRDHASTREIPVLAVSASAMPRDLERAKAAGFAGYVTKPVDVADLIARVEALLPAG
jgi:PAS domain S-box-containing protein